MNEIEKMYENAGIEPSHYDACKIADAYWLNEELANEYGTFDNYMKLNCIYHYQECTDECRHAYDRDTYPPFTAEKQLELIKWLARSKNGIGIDLFGLGNPQGKTVWNIGVEFQWEDYNHTFEHKDFDQALAGLINALWQSLTEEEKQQIKEILE